jgi:hypothetical protein
MGLRKMGLGVQFSGKAEVFSWASCVNSDRDKVATAWILRMLISTAAAAVAATTTLITHN